MSLASTRDDGRDRPARATQRLRPGRMRFDLSRRAVTAALGGVLLSLIAACAVARWENSVSNVEFAGTAKNQAIVLQNGVNEYVSRLVALKTLFESTNRNVTRAEFEDFISRIFEDRPGLFRVSWIPRVKHSERPEHEKAAVADGIIGYAIRSLTASGVAPAPDSEEYYPVHYSTEPKTAPIYGFNVVSDPVRRAVIERARDNDAVATLPAHRRHVQAGNPNGVIVSIPVYAKGASRVELADRRRNINGFISGVVEFSRLINAVISTVPPAGVDLFVHSADGSLVAQAVSGATSTSPTSWLREKLLHALAAEQRWSGTLRIGDADWRLSSTPAAGSRLAASFNHALIVLIVGLALTAIIFAYIRFTDRHDRAVELALTDALTGLANRRAFFERLDFVLAEARDAAEGEKGFAVLYFDLDHFKEVNDAFGHATGDDLLRQAADRLRKILRATDFGARFGGDEFAVLACDAADGATIDALARRIGEAIAEPFEINGAVAHVTASIGIAHSASDLADADAIMMRADLALYRAKEDGRNCYRLHSGELDRQISERAALGDELRDAIGRGELELCYQPQVELATGHILGFEALPRWRHPIRGLVSPELFLPIAKRNGSIVAIYQWAFDEACRRYRAWDDDGIAPNVLAVNLSAIELKALVNLEGEIETSLQRWRIAPNRIEIELTEKVLMTASDIGGGTIETLRQAGLRVALDDFGTGYSSLSYLTASPANRLRIARQIVAGVTADPRNAVVVRTAIRLAKELGIESLAEGVETQAQANALLAAGCEQAQGSYFGAPSTAARATELLRVGRIATAMTRTPKKIVTAA